MYFEPDFDDDVVGEDDGSGLAINECLDHHEECAAWAEKGDCGKYNDQCIV